MVDGVRCVVSVIYLCGNSLLYVFRPNYSSFTPPPIANGIFENRVKLNPEFSLPFSPLEGILYFVLMPDISFECKSDISNGNEGRNLGRWGGGGTQSVNGNRLRSN